MKTIDDFSFFLQSLAHGIFKIKKETYDVFDRIALVLSRWFCMEVENQFLN